MQIHNVPSWVFVHLAHLMGIGQRDGCGAARAQADLGEPSEELAAIGTRSSGEADDTSAERLLAPTDDADALVAVAARHAQQRRAGAVE